MKTNIIKIFLFGLIVIASGFFFSEKASAADANCHCYPTSRWGSLNPFNALRIVNTYNVISADECNQSCANSNNKLFCYNCEGSLYFAIIWKDVTKSPQAASGGTGPGGADGSSTSGPADPGNPWSGRTSAGTGIVPCGETSPCKLCHLAVGISNIVNFGYKTAFFVALLVIVIGGVMYIVSGGNKTTMEMGKKAMWSALVGFAIVLGAWLIVNYTISILAKQDLGIQKQWFGGYTCR